MTHRELFTTIEEVIPTLHGWCTVERASELASMVLSLRPTFSIEVGTWGGRGAIAMALAHKMLNHGQVWAIDPWNRDESVKGQTGANLKWWSEQDHEHVYRHFLEAMNRVGVSDRVLVFRKPSRDVEPPDNIGVAIIDGNHGNEAESDMNRFGPKVQLGGILYADDIHWEGQAVERGVVRLGEIGFRRMYDRDQGAYFQRVTK